ncbi:MAG: hypothetical protein ACJAUP_002843 [Cellvibrionaceae bacterium]|jgi:hypothetical protein
MQASGVYTEYYAEVVQCMARTTLLNDQLKVTPCAGFSRVAQKIIGM